MFGGNDNNNNNNSGGGGGFDIGQLSSLAQNFSSGNHDSSLFSQAASFLQNQGGQSNNSNNNNNNGGDGNEEQQLMNDHDQVHNQPGPNSSGQIGNAAVLSAVQSIMGGGGGGGGFGSGGGDFKSKLISAAMSHAADLYDRKDQEGNAQGSKQDAVNQAAQMAMSIAGKNPSALMGLIGGGNSGGLGAVMNMLK